MFVAVPTETFYTASRRSYVTTTGEARTSTAQMETSTEGSNNDNVGKRVTSSNMPDLYYL